MSPVAATDSPIAPRWVLVRLNVPVLKALSMSPATLAAAPEVKRNVTHRL